MNDDQSFTEWGKVHDAYCGVPVSDPLHAHDALRTREEEWTKERAALPNGHLLSENSFFQSHQNKKIYLLHATNQLEAIKQSGAIHSSAGCLVGAIYCAQVFQDPVTGNFRMHNLGDYIINRELRNYVKTKDEIGKKQSLMVFEIDVPEDCNVMQAGINYLKFGTIHYQLYSKLSYLLSKEERNQLETDVVRKIKKNIPFLMQAENIFRKNHIGIDEAETFLTQLNRANPTMPILAYLYFEALSEYFMLASKDKKTLGLAELGELNNYLYKDMMYSMYSKLNGNFSLSEFSPTPEMIKNYIADQLPQGNQVDYEKCLVYTARRVAFFIRQNFYTSTPQWQTMRYTVNHLSTTMSPLLGHLIHRILRSFGRYQDFYFYFDSLKALEVWNYWNSQDILVPFNGVVPKGEIGINPAYPNLSYKVYEAKKTSKSHLKLVEELDVKIVPRLVNLDMSLLRASGKYALSKEAIHV